jgi:hypothetical protein
MTARNRQLSDAEIYAKANRKRLKRGPQSGYLRRTRPVDASSLKHPTNPETTYELLPVSRTPSLGVMMRPEGRNGKEEEDIQSRVQA